MPPLYESFKHFLVITLFYKRVNVLQHNYGGLKYDFRSSVYGFLSFSPVCTTDETPILFEDGSKLFKV